MEQLGRHEIEGLVRQTKGLFARQPLGRALWSQARQTDPEGSSPAATARHTDAGSAAVDTALPMMGLERRLARRAEALWDSLRAGGALPPAASASALLAPPFSDCAMLAVQSGTVPGQPAGPLRIEYVGQHLRKLANLAPGNIAQDASAGLAEQLVALAGRAIARGAPVSFDTEGTLAEREPAGSSPLLMRAIALPLAQGDGKGSAAVVITSWRELLSVDETAALHRELAAAIDWMHTQKPAD